MSARRDALKAKIAALRAKTMAAGCTEAEAMAAAELAAKLMQDAGLSEADLVMAEAIAHEETDRATWRTTLNGIIGYCTNCTCMKVPHPTVRGSLCIFIGREPGPEIAVYLRDICVRAVKAELKTFKDGTFYKKRRTLATRRQAAADFIDGMVIRLSGRLIELFGPVIDDKARQESKDVMVARFGRGIAINPPDRPTRYSAASNAGWIAGGNVALNRGVAGDAKPALIGDVS